MSEQVAHQGVKSMASPLLQALQTQLMKYPALDPKAVVSVAEQEGLGGGIGDNGTSFGPFQLHYGGAYPSGSAPTGSPQASQQWAWSPTGIDYALNQISQVAGGLKGTPAVTNIVSRFERPANIPNEIAGALRAYGLPAAGGAQAQGLAPSPITAAVAAGQPKIASAPANASPGSGPSLLRVALQLLGAAPGGLKL